MPTPTKSENQAFWVKMVQLVPNGQTYVKDTAGQTLADFAIGALCLATMQWLPSL